MRIQRRESQRGQTIMLMVGAMSLALVVVALTVDGGNAFAQQRAAQNGADSGALAGGVALSNYVACFQYMGLASACSTPSGGWDDNVRQRIEEKATESGVTVTEAWYTDINGNRISASQVGSQSTDRPPNSASGAPAIGVEVRVQRTAEVFVAKLVLPDGFTINTQAHAVAGWVNGDCVITAVSVSGCALLPIAVPLTLVVCDGQNRAIVTGDPWPINDDPDQGPISIPLCGTEPGNVGWVMWEGQGASDLINSVWNASDTDVAIPSWQGVQTGNLSPQDLETALRSHAGDIVMAPRFDYICGPQGDIEPDSSFPIINDPSQWYGCPSAADFGGGNGSNMYYRFPGVYYFEMCEPSLAWCNGLHAAYVNGNNTECNVGGNGATRCIIGRFRTGVGFGAGGSATGSLVQLTR